MFDDNDSTAVKLTINKAYANNYEHWRQKEEKQKRKSRRFYSKNLIFVNKKLSFLLKIFFQLSLGTAVTSKMMKIQMKNLKMIMRK